MSDEEQATTPTDRELLDAVEQARPGVDRGRALYAARQAMQRIREPGSAVAKGREAHTARRRR